MKGIELLHCNFSNFKMSVLNVTNHMFLNYFYQ